MRSYNYSCSCGCQTVLNNKKVFCLCPLLKIISEKNRLKILFILKNGRHCVCEIINHLKLPQSLISHHLADLKKAELVISQKEGKKVYYQLTKTGEKLILFLLEFQKQKEEL